MIIYEDGEIGEIMIGVGYMILVFGVLALIASVSQLIDEYKRRKED